MKNQFRSSLAPHRSGRPLRSAFTILEVIVAVGILLGAMTAIIQLISTGTSLSVQGQFRAEAVILAETKMNEAIAGVVPLQSSSPESIDEAPDWTWEMTTETSSLSDVLTVTVTVTRESEAETEGHSYSITRMVRDPQIFLDAALGE